MEIFTPEFWRNYIKERKSEFKTNRVANKNLWDEAAHFYKDFEKESSYSDIKKLPIKFLQEKNVLHSNMSVADIACGPGTHALDLAQHCREVFALDISEDMINNLKEKISKNSIQNITVSCKDFFKEDFKNKFDLVFVSMSPILNELETIDKLLDISRRYIFLIFWAGKRENTIFNNCYKAIFKKDFKWDILDITAIFNYLYSLGYSPSIFYKNMKWYSNFDFESVYNHIVWHMKFYKDELSEDEKEKIKDILRNSEKSETNVRIGYLFLDKEEYSE